jgi:hypothetical protein
MSGLYFGTSKIAGVSVGAKVSATTIVQTTGNDETVVMSQAAVTRELEALAEQGAVTPSIGDNGNWYVGEIDTGVAAQGNDGFSPTATVEQTDTGAIITITDINGTSTVEILNGEPGTSVAIESVEESDEDGGNNVVTFSDGNVLNVKNGSKGSTGDDGRGIVSIVRTSGSGAAGTTDTYTITYTDNTTSTFAVYNGKDGTNGEDGVSVTHSWNGTTLTVTSASGTSSANLKGDTYILTDSDKSSIASSAAALVDVSDKINRSGDTMTGALVAQNNTNYTTRQVRNIFLIAEGESLPSGSNGDICLVYTP